MQTRAIRTYWLALAFLALMFSLLTGCQAAPAGTSTAAAPVDSGYPVEPPAPTSAPDLNAYPANQPSDLMAVPAAPNGSRVSARLLDQSPAEAAGFVQLHVLVLASEQLPGLPSFTDNLIDQEIYLVVASADLPDMATGEDFTAEVEFRGDEFGGQYFGRNLQKTMP